MPCWVAMKTYSISQLAHTCALSRSTLLFYDRLGLLRASGRTGAGYRLYSDRDLHRLQRIRQLRDAGLSLKEIRSVLASGGAPGTRLLERRMRSTAEEIVGLKNQQRLLAGMLRGVASGKRPRCVDKQIWIEMLKAAGMDQAAMNRWHVEFERRSPEGHQEFLLSLGIPPNEAARIRRLSQGDVGPP
jgi:MerR family transcriptional regulator, thiopeptide resistance regulator